MRDRLTATTFDPFTLRGRYKPLQTGTNGYRYPVASARKRTDHEKVELRTGSYTVRSPVSLDTIHGYT
jgi:hypothetical protein